MSNPFVANINEIENHVLNKFVGQAVETLKLAAVQGINTRINDRVYAYRATADKGVAGVVASRFGAFDAGRQKAIRNDLGRDVAITAAIRAHGVDMRSSKSVLQQLDYHRSFGFMKNELADADSATRMLVDIADAHVGADVQPVATALSNDLMALEGRYGRLIPAGTLADILERIRAGAHGGTIVLNKGLKFRVRQVKCIDETNPEWVGHDEIAWGGVSIDSNETSREIPEHYVGGGFDDGDKKDFNPPYQLCRFSLDGGEYPKTFIVMLSLAEKDSSGLSKFIHDLYEAIKNDVQLILTAMGAAAGAAIGAAAGASIGTIGGPLGSVIGVVAGAILGALVGWLVSALKDDIFAPQVASITFTGANDTFAGGGLVSPVMNLTYQDHGGKYRVQYDWEIVR